MIFALFQLALAACPIGAESPAKVASDAEAALHAYSVFDHDTYVLAYSTVQTDLACTEGKLDPEIVSLYMILESVHADLLGDVDGAARFLRAAQLADPSAVFPDAIIAAKPELGDIVPTTEALPQPTVIEAPDGLSWHVDGREDPLFYEGIEAIVQAVDVDGRVVWTGLVDGVDDLPRDLTPEVPTERGFVAAHDYTLVRVEPGAFTQVEDGRGLAADVPEREVRLTRPFLLGATEVTVELWMAVAGENPAGTAAQQRPARNLTWVEAIRFCNALSRLEGLREVYEVAGDEVTLNADANGYRLPTEAEWAYAARAEAESRYSGGASPAEVSWYKRNSGGRPHIVATKQANPWGLYDMTGNVSEWVWGTDLPWPADLAVNPIDRQQSRYRAIRGGSYLDKGRSLRRATRNAMPAARASEFVGFRIARWLD